MKQVMIDYIKKKKKNHTLSYISLIVLHIIIIITMIE